MLAPVVLADASGVIEFADHSEVDGRYTQQTLTATTVAAAPNAQGSSVVVDFMTQPRVTARLDNRRSAFTLAYTPRVTITVPPDPQTSPILVMHTGSADIAWHDRFVRMDLAEELSFGQTNQPGATAPPAQALPGQPAPPPPPTQQAAVATTITTLGSRTAGTVSARTDRFTSLTTTLAYQLSGGLDAASQQVVPQQKGPRVEASLNVTADRRTHLVTTGYAQRSEFSEGLCFGTDPTMPNTAINCAPQANLIQGTQEVRYAIERTTSMAAGLGGTFAQMRLQPSDPYHVVGFPNALLSTTHEYGERGRGRLALEARLSPTTDFRTGLVSNRLQGTASWTIPANLSTTVRLSVVGTQTVPLDDPNAVTLVGGNLDTGIVVDRRTTLSIGGRGQWQTQAPYGPLILWFVYFGVTTSAPALRF